MKMVFFPTKHALNLSNHPPKTIASLSLSSFDSSFGVMMFFLVIIEIPLASLASLSILQFSFIVSFHKSKILITKCRGSTQKAMSNVSAKG